MQSIFQDSAALIWQRLWGYHLTVNEAHEEDTRSLRARGASAVHGRTRGSANSLCGAPAGLSDASAQTIISL